MANTHIYPEGDTRLGGELKNIVEQMKILHADFEELIGILATFNSDWTAMAAAFGFTGGDAEAHVETMYSLITNAWPAAIDLATYKYVITIMG